MSKQVNYLLSPLHLMFLGTFIKPRPLKQIPDIPYTLPYSHWGAALRESVDQVATKFIKQDLIEVADIETHLDYYLNKEQLRKLLEQGALETTGTKDQLIGRTLQLAPRFLPKFEEDMNLYAITEKGKVVMQRFLSDAKNIETDLASENQVKKAIIFILLSATAGVIGNRADAAFLSSIRRLLGRKQDAAEQQFTAKPIPAIGSMSGVVSDWNDACLPGVLVRLKSEQLLGYVQEAITDENGFFLFSALSVGTYTLFFHKIGFKSAKRESVVVKQGHTLVSERLFLGTIADIPLLS